MIDRREFMALAAGGVMLGMAEGAGAFTGSERRAKSKVALIKTASRETGVKQAIDVLGVNPAKGKRVLLKPNFNTADPFPASTHNDTLRALILKLRDMGATAITVGERSGPPDTADVIKEMGVDTLLKEMGVGLINFEELPGTDWVRVKPQGTHWLNGFDVARPVVEAECVVSTCCIKTHRYGGVFTMSLKLSVGVTHKRNMTELHTSPFSMRKMIAEINQAYSPSLILMDGIEAFVDGGPSSGVRRRGDVILAATDRVAADAVGLAVLKSLGSNSAIMGKRIFEQEQIKRAAELGLGARGPEDIEIITAGDAPSVAYAAELTDILSAS